MDRLSFVDEIRTFSFYVIAIFALLLVFGGPVLYGASRWIDFGIFKIQPSEIAKWTTMIMGASILARSKVGGMQDSLQWNCKGWPLF